jgi:chorismate-pyruvate lyase
LSVARSAIVVLALLLATAAAAQQPRWTDTYESRVEILALLQTLNADILASTSATQVLERWCREHELAGEPRLVAHRVTGVDKPPTAEQLQRLGVSDVSELRYRRVALRCGAFTLSEADNWYVPGRLTEEMNRLLDTTNTPFGIAVRPLQPYRRTIAVTQLWSPLAKGWERHRRPRTRWRRRGVLTVPKDVFVHEAILYTATHQPFAEVRETYQSQLLAFDRDHR